MDIKELKEELLKKKLRHYYVFIGDELALQDVYIDKIKEISGRELVRADDVKSIYTKLTSKTLFKAIPAVYVVRNDEDFYKSTAWKDMLKMKDFKGNILILLYSGVKKSSDFCKAHEAVLTSFDLISPGILKNRLMATTGMPADYCADIVKLCGGNYGRIKNEVYKMNILLRAKGYNWNIAYLEAKKQHLIHEEIGDIIFDFTNAIVDRNIKKAYELYPKIMQTEDGSAIKLLSVLYNTFRQILMVQSTNFKERKEEVLGLSKGVIYMTAQKCGKYNLFELVKIVKKIREIEKGIKIGTVEEKFAMPYLLGSIW